MNRAICCLILVNILYSAIESHQKQFFNDKVVSSVFEKSENCNETYLFLENKNLPKIEAYFINNTCITLLRMWRDKIETIAEKAFDGLTKMTVLDLRYNNLTNFFTFGPHANLWHVDVSDNFNAGSFINFSSISGKYPKLQSIYASRSSVSELISDLTDDLPSLNELQLSGNPLTTLKNIPKTITHLTLDDAAQLDSNSFKESLGNVKVLSLKRNKYFKVLDNPDSEDCDEKYLCLDLPELEQLMLDDSSIKAVTNSAFAKLKKLTDLYLSGNDLMPIPDPLLRSIPNLRSLDISGMTLMAGPNFNLIPNLTELAMNNMKDKSELVKFLESKFNLSKLKKFLIDQNDLTYVPMNTLGKLNELEYFSLTLNKIKKLHFPIIMSHLKRMDMAYNSVSNDYDLPFNSTTSLEYIDIRFNYVTSLRKKILKELPDNFVIHF